MGKIFERLFRNALDAEETSDRKLDEAADKETKGAHRGAWIALLDALGWSKKADGIMNAAAETESEGM